MISNKFREAVKLHPKPQYKLAWEAGINPTTLSQIVTGYIKPKVGDQRVIRVAELLGLKPSQCFKETEVRHANCP